MPGGKYPERLVRGFSLDSQKAINHHCKMKVILGMKNQIGEEAYAKIEDNSQLGVILKFAALNLHWSSKIVQHLLGNMLSTAKMHELWALVDTRPIRFSLKEFEHITRLKCGLPEPFVSKNDTDRLWSEMGFRKGVGPNWSEISTALERCSEWPPESEKRRMVGLLVVLQVVIFGKHAHSPIPFNYAEMVMDPGRFESYPWGRVAFDVLVSSIRSVSVQAHSYTLHGFLQVLQAWALEHIPQLGEMYGRRRDAEIPLLRWEKLSIPRGFRMEDVFEADKAKSAKKKVRVVHSFEGETSPVWPDEVEDPEVEKMIRDIVEGTLDESFWAVPVPSKRKVEEQVDLVDITKKKKRNSNEEKEFHGETHGQVDILKELMQALTKTLEVVRKDQILISQRVGHVEGALKCSLDARSVDDAVVEARLRKLETFTDQQHDYNDRVSRVLERLEGPNTILEIEGAKGKDDSCASQTRDSDQGKLADDFRVRAGEVRRNLADDFKS